MEKENLSDRRSEEIRRLKAALKDLGWTNIDLAAHWGHSVDYISWLINNPRERPPAYADAFRGLLKRELVNVVRSSRHHSRKRKPKQLWSHSDIYAKGNRFETDSSTGLLQVDPDHKVERLEDGLTLVVTDVSRTLVKRLPSGSRDWRVLTNTQTGLTAYQYTEVDTVSFVIESTGEEVTIERGPELHKLLDIGGGAE